MSVLKQRESPARRKDHRRILLGSVADLAPGTRLNVQVGRLSVAVFNVAGQFHAIYGRCPHQGAPLSRGKLQGTVICNRETNWETQWAHEGEVVVCPGHAMEFHLTTGYAFGYGFNLRTFPVSVEEGSVYLHV